MDQAANAAGVADLIHALLQVAADEQIAGKKGFNDTNDSAAGGSLQTKPRMKDFETEIAVEIGRGYVLVLWLRPHAVPCWFLKRLDIRSVQFVFQAIFDSAGSELSISAALFISNP